MVIPGNSSTSVISTNKKVLERREPTISFFSPLHARLLASMMSSAGARLMKERDGKIRQLINIYKDKTIRAIE